MAPSNEEDDVGRDEIDFARYRARRTRQRLFELLDTLRAAIETRELQMVWDVFDEEEARRYFPAALREEALTIMRLPIASFRAPVRLFRFYHQLRQLGDEPLEPVGDPRQLGLDLGPSDDIQLARRALPFPDRHREPPDDPSRGGGADRRRSGSR